MGHCINIKEGDEGGQGADKPDKRRGGGGGGGRPSLRFLGGDWMGWTLIMGFSSCRGFRDV